MESTSGQLLAVLNINNMIPIPEVYIKKLDYKDVNKYKKFENEKLKEYSLTAHTIHVVCVTLDIRSVIIAQLHLVRRLQ
ncbi:MAG: type III toxin-antitoxin system ToxN/AbiQ family toxin [Acetivibrionales bacterium]